MKKVSLILLNITFCVAIFAQHEGIQRHFESYKIKPVVINDNTYANDTLTDEFHLFLPQQKVSYNNLGWMSPGNPYLTAVYSEQPDLNPFWFFNNLGGFVKKHDDVIYFDAHKPFTLFTFSGGGGLECVKFLHTQNITPTLNFAFDYEIANSDSYYQENNTKVNALSFATAYTKRRYQSHFNFIINKVNRNENGGLADMEAFDTTYYASNVYATNLSDIESELSQIGIQYNHEYRFGSYSSDTVVLENDTAISKVFDSKFSIIHDIKLDRYYRIYTGLPTDFYQNNFDNDTLTYDSVSYKTLNNSFLLNFNVLGQNKIKKIQILAGISNLLYDYYYFDTVGSTTYLSNYITGLLNFDTKSGEFQTEINYCFLGTDIFDMNLNVKYQYSISKNFKIKTYYNYLYENPSIFYFNYYSNHFKWNTDPLKVLKNSGGINFEFVKLNLNLGANVNLLKNYFVFNNLAMPVQIEPVNIIADAYITKQFNLGSFHWFTKFTYQYITDNTKVPLPEFVGYSNIYFKKWIFKGAMQFQIGVDVKYHSGIYGYAYMPAIGAFYLQNSKEFGNYPNAGIYTAIKVKRLRGFVKLSNFNSIVMQKNYYLLYAIPDNPFSFNFGISWEFYD